MEELDRQYTRADIQYLIKPVDDLINAHKSQIAAQEISTILNKRIETALQASASISAEISLNRYRIQLEARLRYLDIGKDAELIAQARRALQTIEQRRGRFIETQTPLITNRLKTAIKTIMDEMNALTLVSFTTFNLVERIQRLKLY